MLTFLGVALLTFALFGYGLVEARQIRVEELHKHSLPFLRNAGFTVLRGESVQAGGIIIAGVDDPSAMHSRQPAGAEAANALASAGANDFVVLLKRQPVVDGNMPFDLQLSGHIHGGQIFPFVYVTRMFYRVHTGLTKLADGRLLYVSRGTGAWGPPVRVFALPEITLISITTDRK